MALGLRGADAVVAAAEADRAQRPRSPSRTLQIDRFLLEPMVEGVVAEMLVGVTIDPHFGPVLVIGAGGIFVELLRDASRLLLPATRADIESRAPAPEDLSAAGWFPRPSEGRPAGAGRGDRGDRPLCRGQSRHLGGDRRQSDHGPAGRAGRRGGGRADRRNHCIEGAEMNTVGMYLARLLDAYGIERRLRHSGRPHGRALSRPAGRAAPPRHAAPRAGRRLHGRRLCARDRQAGRLLRHHRAGHDQHRHRDGAGLSGFHPDAGDLRRQRDRRARARATAVCTSCRTSKGWSASVSAFSHTLHRAEDLPAVLARAFAVFGSGRPRPVHIEIPLDVMARDRRTSCRRSRAPLRRPAGRRRPTRCDARRAMLDGAARRSCCSAAGRTTPARWSRARGAARRAGGDDR